MTILHGHPLDLAEALARRPIWRVGDLIDSGISRKELRSAAGRGSIERISHGVVGTPEAALHPRLEDILACLATGGVICCRTAGMRHGLTDDMPAGTEILVPHGQGRRRASEPFVLYQTRDEAAFTVGVDSEEIAGVTVRMTDKPRTVVDLVRGPVRQHAAAAVHAYLAEGGTGDELDKVASHFGRPAQEQISLLVEGTLQGMSRSYGS